jgi:hypothetical protein
VDGEPTALVSLRVHDNAPHIGHVSVVGTGDEWDKVETHYGPHVVRKAMMQLKEQHPKLTELRGLRVTGARRFLPADDPRKVQRVKLPATRQDAGEHVELKHVSSTDYSDEPRAYPLLASHTYHVHVNGEHAASLRLNQLDGSPHIGRLGVTNSDGGYLDKEQHYGPHIVRKAMMLLKERHPELTELRGMRLSGARGGLSLRDPRKEQVVKLPA